MTLERWGGGVCATKQSSLEMDCAKKGLMADRGKEKKALDVNIKSPRK